MTVFQAAFVFYTTWQAYNTSRESSKLPRSSSQTALVGSVDHVTLVLQVVEVQDSPVISVPSGPCSRLPLCQLNTVTSNQYQLAIKILLRLKKTCERPQHASVPYLSKVAGLTHTRWAHKHTLDWIYAWEEASLTNMFINRNALMTQWAEYNGSS